MIITLGFYKRKPGLSTEDFWRIWSTEYGPLYANNPALHKYLRRYTQHQLKPQDDTPTQFVGFDGFSEAWFENAADRETMHQLPYYQEVLKPLAERFLDLENSKFAAYDTQVYQVGGPPPLFDRSTL
ncbi:MAG: EthD domain-containing protein [Burkholderiales bacterium]